MTTSNWDWQEFLMKAQAGKADLGEKDIARDLAGSWDTCACGELHSLTGKGELQGEPEDLIQYRLGLDFDKAIWHGEYFRAEELLHAIWDREAALTKQVFAGMGTAAAAERQAEVVV